MMKLTHVGFTVGYHKEKVPEGISRITGGKGNKGSRLVEEKKVWGGEKREVG